MSHKSYNRISDCSFWPFQDVSKFEDTQLCRWAMLSSHHKTLQKCVTTFWAVWFFPVRFFLWVCVCLCVWRAPQQRWECVKWCERGRGADETARFSSDRSDHALGMKTSSQDVECGPLASDITSCFCDGWFEGRGRDFISALDVSSHQSKSGCHSP